MRYFALVLWMIIGSFVCYMCDKLGCDSTVIYLVGMVFGIGGQIILNINRNK